jgi:hypothetical protein
MFNTPSFIPTLQFHIYIKSTTQKTVDYHQCQESCVCLQDLGRAGTFFVGTSIENGNAKEIQKYRACVLGVIHALHQERQQQGGDSKWSVIACVMVIVDAVFIAERSCAREETVKCGTIMATKKLHRARDKRNHLHA